MVLDAVAGVEVSTELIWEQADQQQIPIIAYINKMDRENADYYKALEGMQNILSRHIIPLPVSYTHLDVYKRQLRFGPKRY